MSIAQFCIFLSLGLLEMFLIQIKKDLLLLQENYVSGRFEPDIPLTHLLKLIGRETHAKYVLFRCFQIRQHNRC